MKTQSFREILRVAVEREIVTLPDNLMWEYDTIKKVYRMVTFNDAKRSVTKEDFRSQAEIPEVAGRKGFDEHDIGNYGCSFFVNLEELKLALRLPRNNKAIAEGPISCEYGPIELNDRTGHLLCFLYESATPEKDFEVI